MVRMFSLAAATAASNDPVTISTTAYAPWASDPALEAAALLSQHGNQTLRAFWEAWAVQTPTDDSSLRSSLALAEPLLRLPATLEQSGLWPIVAKIRTGAEEQRRGQVFAHGREHG